VGSRLHTAHSTLHKLLTSYTY
jgi:hypothetical protein